MEEDRIAEGINILADFCGQRDLEYLSQRNLKEKYNFEQADIMILFGGSIICGGDILAKAMKNQVAKKYVISGGAGHTTETLRAKMKELYPEVETNNLTEAEIFSNYLQAKYNLTPDLLETNSTNCGNNITNCLDLFKKHNINFSTLIIVQDATMQKRMEAGFHKYLPEDKIIINYAVYKVKTIFKDNQLKYDKDIEGMWNMERYISLLMGEISRLQDNEKGYGPYGKNFIAHVDIPNNVLEAFNYLKEKYKNYIRIADERYSSNNNLI